MNLSSLYQCWLKAGRTVNGFMTHALFTVLYVLVVPPFALFGKILKKNETKETYWSDRECPVFDNEFFERLG